MPPLRIGRHGQEGHEHATVLDGQYAARHCQGSREPDGTAAKPAEDDSLIVGRGSFYSLAPPVDLP